MVPCLRGSFIKYLKKKKPLTEKVKGTNQFKLGSASKEGKGGD